MRPSLQIRDAALLALVLMALGCRCYMSCTPRPLESTSRAKKVIYEVLDQQPREWAAIDIEVTDEKFRLLRSVGTGFLGLRPATLGTTVYYTKIGDNLLSKRRGVFAVTIRAPNRDLLVHVYTDDQASAERFIDALETMRRASAEARASGVQ
jgi:hypothetical protein